MQRQRSKNVCSRAWMRIIKVLTLHQLKLKDRVTGFFLSLRCPFKDQSLCVRLVHSSISSLRLACIPFRNFQKSNFCRKHSFEKSITYNLILSPNSICIVYIVIRHDFMVTYSYLQTNNHPFTIFQHSNLHFKQVQTLNVHSRRSVAIRSVRNHARILIFCSKR